MAYVFIKTNNYNYKHLHLDIFLKFVMTLHTLVENLDLANCIAYNATPIIMIL